MTEVLNWTKISSEWGVYHIGESPEGKYVAISDENPKFCFEEETIGEASKKADLALQYYRSVVDLLPRAEDV